MAGTMTKIKPFHPEMRPPKGGVAAGVTPDGKQLWRRVSKRAKAVPRLDKNGNREFRNNRLTGEQLYPLNQAEIFEHDELFYQESHGNGNVAEVPFRFPTPKELAEAERKQKVAQMSGQLAEALVDEGVSPADLVRALRGRTPVPAPVAPVAQVEAPTETETETETESEKDKGDPSETFPVKMGGGWFRFSDGSKKQCKEEEAIEIEQDIAVEVARAQADAAAVPEV